MTIGQTVLECDSVRETCGAVLRRIKAWDERTKYALPPELRGEIEAAIAKAERYENRRVERAS